MLLQLLALKFKLAGITLSSGGTQLTLSASLPTLPTGSSVQQAMNRASTMCAKVSKACIDPPDESAIACIYQGVLTQDTVLSVLFVVVYFTIAIILKRTCSGCRYYFTNEESMH